MAEQQWTDVDAIVAQWRPLKPAEAQRAPGLIAFVERAIARTWPDVPARLADRSLELDSVRDVVVWLVIPILAPSVDLPPTVKSWQETAQSESRSVTLDGSAAVSMLRFAGWMVDVFEGKGAGVGWRVGPVPVFDAPSGGHFEGLFPSWPEEEVPRRGYAR